MNLHTETYLSDASPTHDEEHYLKIYLKYKIVSIVIIIDLHGKIFHVETVSSCQ